MHLSTSPNFNGGRGVYFEDYKSECAAGSPTIVFCHSLFMDCSMFWNQVIRFKSKYRVVVWDQRGHGKTATDKPWSFWDSADDLIHLMDSLSIEKAVVVGISMGGYVAMRAAIKYPHRVSGVVIMASTSDAEAHADVWEGLKVAWITHGPSNELLSNLSLVMFNSTHLFIKQEWESKWKSMKREHVAFAITAIQTRDSIKEQLCKVQAPALVISAEKDAEYSEDHARELCQLLPQSFGVTISGAPHFVVLSHPEEVNEHMESFFEAIFEG